MNYFFIDDAGEIKELFSQVRGMTEYNGKTLYPTRADAEAAK